MSPAKVMDESPAPPKKRDVPLAVLHVRAARQVVAAFVPKVGPWQERVAKLLALAARAPSAADRARLRDEHASLLAEVEVALADLERQIVEAPKTVQEHSRVSDARRAAAIVRRRLDEVGALLG